MLFSNQSMIAKEINFSMVSWKNPVKIAYLLLSNGKWVWFCGILFGQPSTYRWKFAGGLEILTRPGGIWILADQITMATKSPRLPNHHGYQITMACPIAPTKIVNFFFVANFCCFFIVCCTQLVLILSSINIQKLKCLLVGIYVLSLLGLWAFHELEWEITRVPFAAHWRTAKKRCEGGKSNHTHSVPPKYLISKFCINSLTL